MAKDRGGGGGGGHRTIKTTGRAGIGIPAVPWDKPKPKPGIKLPQVLTPEQRSGISNLGKAVQGMGKNLDIFFALGGRKKK